MKISFLLTTLTLVYLAHSNLVNHLSHQTNNHQFAKEFHARSSTGSGGWWVGFIFGPILFICAFICIWFNQKRAAIDARRLKLGRQICEDVDVTSQASARSKDGKLVYANGNSRTNNIIGDQLSGVNGPNLLKITRLVEVLEWRKKTRKQNDHQVQYYDLEWVSSNSQNEGQRFNNPANWFIKNDVIYNSQVYLGGYNLSKEVVDKCNKVVPFTPTLQNAQIILQRTNRGDRAPSLNGQYIYYTPAGGQFNGMGGGGQGTLRVRFLLCPTGPLSLVGQSSGPSFSSFDIAGYEGTKNQTNNVPDCCCCMISACYAQLLKPVELLLEVYEQNVNKDDIFDRAVEKSECFTRVMRILAFACMVFGIYLFFSPIVNLIGFIPLVGGIISSIVGFAIFLAAFLIAIPLYILAISIAWLFFHPKVGLALLAIGGIILAVILIVSKSKENDSPAVQNAHFMTLRQLIL